MSTLVSLSDNCGTKPGWDGWSWSTETSDPSLLLVSFLIDPYLLPFVICCVLLSVTKMHDAQKEAQYPSSIEILMGGIHVFLD